MNRTTTIDETSLAAAQAVVHAARSLLVITGAGMSAECGIPTFRDPDSTLSWDEQARLLATAEGFQADPQRVWTWYLHRRREAVSAEPHPGYRALAAWERRAEVSVVTQNVDGLHRRSGSTRVVELHGTLHRSFCLEHRHPLTGVEQQEQVPRCPRCGSYVRPAVVWFGEAIPREAERGMAEALGRAEAVVLVGTSLMVSTPVALLVAAARRGLPIVEVNPDPALPRRADDEDAWRLPVATVVLPGPAASTLARLLIAAL